MKGIVFSTILMFLQGSSKLPHLVKQGNCKERLQGSNRVSGRIRRRESYHRLRQSSRLLLRDLRCAGDRAAHPHHRKQLHQVLHPPETVGEERVRGGEGPEEK